MTAEELWREFTAESPQNDGEYTAWSFGAEADLLARLAADGRKTATSSAYPLYELEKEPIPEPGTYSVVLNSKQEAICVIQTKKVSVVPFDQVTGEHAYKEGEGDRTLRFWKAVHEKFFSECLKEAGLQFAPDMRVVCEEFEVVYKG